MDAASSGVDVQCYTPLKLFLFMLAFSKAIAVSLEAAITVLPSLLYTYPMLPLVATLAISEATLDSQSAVLNDKE